MNPYQSAYISHLYLKENKTLVEVADIVDKSPSYVHRVLKKHHIPMRKAHRRIKSSITRQKRSDGYIQVIVPNSDPFASMGGSMTRRNGKKRNGKRMLEHRYVMAKHLNRCLEPWEHVHHINHIRSDNRIENLTLTTPEKNSIEAKLWVEVLELRKQILTNTI